MKRPRHQAGVLAACLELLAALALGEAALACRHDAGPRAAGANAEQRARVIAFWQKQNAATDARMRRDHGAAVDLYEAALELEPGHEDALYYLGQCRRELGRAGEARVAFERLVEVNPSSARGHLALGALLASPDPGEPLDLTMAEQHLRRAHAINGEETGPMVRLGEVLLAMGRRDEALGWFEAALRTNTKSVEAAFLAGFIAWERRSTDAGRAVRRVLEAARVEGPVKGALSEGDRKDAKRVAAPPLTSPLGRLLFGEPVRALRVAAVADALDSRRVVAQWREVRRLRAELTGRSAVASKTYRP
jgi:tetratricopeptide (TPR) repeat protein